MAGDWIKMRNDLADDPAVIGIASRLGVDEFSIVGRLHRFWSWADRHSRDGHAAGVTKAWLDRYVQCDGFADAMESFGWLVIENGGITVPNFDRHNGESAKKRGLATERKRKQRAVTELSTDMSRNERDKSVTREEKRREEISPSLRSGDSAASRGSRLPEGWTLPDDWAVFCKAERPDLVPNEVAERFADYWHSAAGAKGRKSDWFATWRNWVRAEKKTAHSPVSYAQQDELAKRRRWEEMTGRKWPTESGDVFDITESENPLRLQRAF